MARERMTLTKISDENLLLFGGYECSENMDLGNYLLSKFRKKFRRFTLSKFNNYELAKVLSQSILD
jgi:hypothetical protein